MQMFVGALTTPCPLCGCPGCRPIGPGCVPYGPVDWGDLQVPNWSHEPPEPSPFTIEPIPDPPTLIYSGVGVDFLVAFYGEEDS